MTSQKSPEEIRTATVEVQSFSLSENIFLIEATSFLKRIPPLASGSVVIGSHLYGKPTKLFDWTRIWLNSAAVSLISSSFLGLRRNIYAIYSSSTCFHAGRYCTRREQLILRSKHREWCSVNKIRSSDESILLGDVTVNEVVKCVDFITPREKVCRY